MKREQREVVGMRLRELRGKKTQKEVAEAIGVTNQSVSQYESGNKTPSDDIKVKIAAYFKCSIEEIFFKSKSTK